MNVVPVDRHILHPLLHICRERQIRRVGLQHVEGVGDVVRPKGHAVRPQDALAHRQGHTHKGVVIPERLDLPGLLFACLQVEVLDWLDRCLLQARLQNDVDDKRVEHLWIGIPTRDELGNQRALARYFGPLARRGRALLQLRNRRRMLGRRHGRRDNDCRRASRQECGRPALGCKP